MATVVTTIADYSTEVCKRAGSQYSLFTTRAINLLPEAMKQVLLANNFESNELFKDESNNGSLVYNKEILIPAEADSSVYLDKTDSRILQILNVVLNVRGTDCLVSLIQPELHPYSQYLSFDTAIDLVTYDMDSNAMILQNLTSPLAEKHAVVSYRKTQFENTLLTDSTTDLGLYFSYSVILQLIKAGVELLKQETVL
jgi:hypothetical protein